MRGVGKQWVVVRWVDGGGGGRMGWCCVGVGRTANEREKRKQREIDREKEQRTASGGGGKRWAAGRSVGR